MKGKKVPFIFYLEYLINEPTHKKTYNKTCVSSKDRFNLCSLVRVFIDHMCLLQPPGYPERNKRESLLFRVDVQADASLFWLYRSYYKFCCALAQIQMYWVAEWLVPNYGSQVPGLNPTGGEIQFMTVVLHCTGPLIIILPSS